jgi:ABC-type Fe3+-siderophore transport system permease subunit
MMLEDWKIGAKLTFQFLLAVIAGCLVAGLLSTFFIILLDWLFDLVLDEHLIEVSAVVSLLTIPVFVRDIRRQIIADWEFTEKLGPNPKM